MELIINHASIRIPTVWGSQSFQEDEHFHMERMTHLNSTETEAPALGTLPNLDLCISLSSCLYVLFIVSFNKLVNIRTVNPSPSSVSHFGKLIKLKRKMWEPQIYSPPGQKHE